MSDFSASAELHRLEMSRRRMGHSIPASTRLVYWGSVSDCVQRVMIKREPDRVLYSMTVPAEAGFAKTVLDYKDIEAIAQRTDFPNG